MDTKNKTLIPLIIIAFIFGAVIGYLAHQPGTIEKTTEKPVYINRTIEVIKEVTVTPAQTTPAPTPTLQAQDFTVKNYDPSKDKPSYTIELNNYRATPDTLSIHPGDGVLIKITDTSLYYPMALIINQTYQKNLGTSGAVVVTFNKKDTYDFKSVIPSSDPTIIPRTYAEGKITVY